MRGLSRESPAMAFLPGNGTVVLTTGFISATHANYSHEDDCRHQPSAISEYRSEIAVKQHLQFVTAYQGRVLE